MSDEGTPNDGSDGQRAVNEEAEAERRFQETLGRLVNTPHKPHERLKKGREPKPAPKGS